MVLPPKQTDTVRALLSFCLDKLRAKNMTQTIEFVAPIRWLRETARSSDRQAGGRATFGGAARRGGVANRPAQACPASHNVQYGILFLAPDEAVEEFYEQFAPHRFIISSRAGRRWRGAPHAMPGEQPAGGDGAGVQHLPQLVCGDATRHHDGRATGLPPRLL